MSAVEVPIINSVDSIEARFVRITVLGADVYTGPWVSLTELRVFGEGERTYSSVDDLLQSEVVLSPNPANSIVTIEGGEAFEMVSVYDQSGKRVIHRNINRSGTIDIGQLQTGIYLVTLEGSDRSYTTKLIKQ
jgi:hypothetical protein